MDEEKFSVERFWELMGVAPRGETVEGKDMEPDLSTEGKMFHVERSLCTDVRETGTVGTEEKKPTVETEAVTDEVGENRAEKAKPSEDRRDVLRARAVRRDTAEVETVAKPKRVGVAKRVVEAVRRVFGWSEAASNGAVPAAIVEAETVEAEREMSGDVERKQGAIENTLWEHVVRWDDAEDDDLDRSTRRNSDRFRKAKSRPVLHGREGKSSANRRFAGEIAESDGVLTESRGKIAEFRKSDESDAVDLRAISRAIERDSRRY